MEETEKYEKATFYIDCDNRLIKEKAAELTKGVDDISLRATTLFYFVRDKIQYNPYLFTDVQEDYRASRIFENGEGFCIQKAVLLAALARSVGISVRLRFADIQNHIVPEKLAMLNKGNVFIYHGYDEFYIEGRWIKATPAFDLRMCEENGIIPVEFDGMHHGTFHPYDLEGRLHIEYLHDWGHYHDLPFDKIIDAHIRTYGPDYFEGIKRFRETRKAR